MACYFMLISLSVSFHYDFGRSLWLLLVPFFLSSLPVIVIVFVVVVAVFHSWAELIFDFGFCFLQTYFRDFYSFIFTTLQQNKNIWLCGAFVLSKILFIFLLTHTSGINIFLYAYTSSLVHSCFPFYFCINCVWVFCMSFTFQACVIFTRARERMGRIETEAMMEKE